MHRFFDDFLHILINDFQIFNILAIIVAGSNSVFAGFSSAAHSFMHFHGPVVGPDFEVKVPYFAPHSEPDYLHGEHHHHHHHDHYSQDYVAHPKYEFSYGVQDHHTGDFHGQKEHRDGNTVHGEYSVIEPGGTIRVVSYHADKDGFHAVVHTSGKNDHSSGTYDKHGQNHHFQGLHRDDHHEDGLKNYATYPTQEGYL
ncbi:histidine-rich glycoprotein-like [Leptopilina heterotoma]|uniref:histidine-rich glycoprotein-like n=1 Tax=Leptopilina heterotoma TaxID=63436 RepID=UPI001CA9CF7C|nr:histidine-rich glycoprotein-like [Leptopilina heterotoma]